MHVRQSGMSVDAMQGVLFDAMRKAKLIAEGASWQQLKYSRCGRTDKGVSAAGQVTFLPSLPERVVYAQAMLAHMLL